jgi:PAS domain S-box-containing protein
MNTEGIEASAKPRRRPSAREKLRQSEQNFRLLVSSVKDYAIIMLDPGGRILTWNEGAERLKGYKEAEIVGRSMECLYPAEARAAGKPAHLLTIATATGRVEDEGWRVRKDGSRFFADVIITALYNPDGTLAGFAKVTRDITERRRTERRSRRAKPAIACWPRIPPTSSCKSGLTQGGLTSHRRSET